MTYLSDHFSFDEVIHSETASRLGIDNSLPEELIEAVKKTAKGLEQVRYAVGSRPVSISSWYRSPALNTAIGSKPTSQHIKGEAVDFICPAFGSPAEVCKALLGYKNFIKWDQLILEHTWIHISWNSAPAGVQRGQVLSLLQDGSYGIGLTSANGLPLI